MTIPLSVIRAIDTLPSTLRNSLDLNTRSVHGLLAAELALERVTDSSISDSDSNFYSAWRSSLPSPASLESSLPILWPSTLQDLLPPTSRSLLSKQHRKLTRDWDAVSSKFPTLSHDVYRHAWLLVNSRTFYYTSPDPNESPREADDCLALVPYADYFNHTAGISGCCKVSYYSSGFEICAPPDRQVDQGQELYISYGNHSNDVLLVEYGFILDENKWDEISLDEVMGPLFDESTKNRLDEAGFWGNFKLDKDTICYRTQVALKALCMPPRTWKRVLAKGAFEDGDKYQLKADELLLKALKAYLLMVVENLRQISALGDDEGMVSQRQTLKRRWEQIHLLLTTAVARIED
ncbi:uncharacterized protein Z518_06764 [Rhinocladiella mackenziei CBS 650.93]|uniref:SET domain-containing protein n=1 Tax=Rhinocladiella mackenziei CBS 650.93 TaxID=1442369 RepID=A0A0D2FMI4_9EURO|nr:uncharacterized protein Z518_06764 [Rhinocladiella mackenziei CBS 650.93]KIX03212.1 hypothetical protein Z518_06764 [Rhinocladiella mackenziei CBS 650.93]